MTAPPTNVENEFAGLPAPTRVARRWVNVITGGHISGVVWGVGAPELVLLHDAGGSARSWDAVLLALDRPAVALDLPGHGRSSDGPGGDNGPARAGRPVAEAIRSFAPRHRLVAGRGLGALTALATGGRLPAAVHRIVLIDGLPDPSSDERLWATLAGQPEPPVLILTGGGAGDEAVARFRRESPTGVVQNIATDQPEALAGAIAAALTEEEPTP